VGGSSLCFPHFLTLLFCSTIFFAHSFNVLYLYCSINIYINTGDGRTQVPGGRPQQEEADHQPGGVVSSVVMIYTCCSPLSMLVFLFLFCLPGGGVSATCSSLSLCLTVRAFFFGAQDKGTKYRAFTCATYILHCNRSISTCNVHDNYTTHSYIQALLLL
jgi:hypothetical protein